MTTNIELFFQTLKELKAIKKEKDTDLESSTDYITLTGFAKMVGLTTQTLNTKLLRAIAQKAKNKPSRAKVFFPLPVTRTNIGYLWKLEDVEEYTKNYKKLKENK